MLALHVVIRKRILEFENGSSGGSNSCGIVVVMVVVVVEVKTLFTHANLSTEADFHRGRVIKKYKNDYKSKDVYKT